MAFKDLVPVRRLLLSCACACGAPLAAAQVPGLDPAKALTQYGVDAWSIDQGLPNATVNAILQTRDGYLWVGTHEGLARFDGQRFTVFNRSSVQELGNNGVRALCEDRDAGLWIGTNGGGLARLHAGRFTHFGEAEGLPAASVWSLLCDARDGSVWIGTNGGGLSRYRQGRFSNSAPGDSGRVVSAIVADPQGGAWLATQGDGLRHVSASGAWSALTREDGLPLDALNALALARDGTLWIGSAGAGVSRVRDGRVMGPLNALAPLSGVNVARFLEDRDGTLWIATNGAGLGRLAGGRLTMFSGADGLPADVVYSLWQDRDGTLWLGTNGGGLGRLRDGSFTVYGQREGLSGDFAYTALEDRDGRLWVGTARGLDRLEGGRFVHVPLPGAGPVAVRSLAEDGQGGLWIATYGAGIFRLSGGRYTQHRAKDGLAHDNVRAVLVDPQGRLWAATLNGLSVFAGGVWHSYSSRDGLPKDSLIGLALDRDGALWVGSDGAGLARLKDGRFQVFGTGDGLASNVVLALFVDGEGTLWVGTNGGLSRRKGERFTSYTAASGLPSDSVTQIADDGGGELWLGSSRGVSRVAKRALEQHAAHERQRLPLLTFDRVDGLRSSQCTAPGQPAGLRTRDGRLWFATTQGIVVVDVQRLRSQAGVPPVAVEEVLLDGRRVDPASVRVPPGTSRLEFRYTGVALLAPSRVGFRFQLQGFDDDWVESTGRAAQYTGLPPGDYVFRVSARIGEGSWNPAPAAVALVVLPRFYETRTFAVAVLLALVALSAGVHRLRVRRLEASRQQLAALVDERTRSLAEEKLQAERLLAATQAVGSTLDITSVLDLILGELQRVVPYDSASVQELRGRRLEVVGGRGFEDLPSLLGRGFDADSPLHPNGEVLRRRAPVVLADAPAAYADFDAAPSATGIRSWMGVPLVFGERLTGMLTLDKREPAFYTDGHALVAQAFAAQAAVALENARLYGAARQELAERERAESLLRRQGAYLSSLHETALAIMNRLELDVLLEALVDRAARLLQASHGFLYLETRDRRALELRVWFGAPPRDRLVRPGEGAVGHAWQAGQPLSIPQYDAWEGRSPQVPAGSYGPVVAVPLRVGGRVAGALALAHGPNSPWGFADAEVELLASFGQLASIALDNASLFAREHAAREQAERLQAATRALSATIDLSAVADLILYELRRVVPADSASIQELKGARLEIVAGCGHAAAAVGRRFDPAAGDGRSQQVLSSRAPLIREAAPYADGAFDGSEPAGLRSWMGVPLLFGERVIGMLALNKREPGFYTPELAELAQAFAAQAAVAIENARLFAGAKDELEQRTRAQQALQESEERFRQLAENIDAVFFMRSLDPPRVLYVSPAYERVWGRPREALYEDTRALLASLHPDDRETLSRAIASGEGYEIEYRIVRPDGTTRWIHSRAFPFKAGDGGVARVAGIAEDITARKQAERLRADLTHTIVHDLKNPLTAILGCAELLVAEARPGSHEERTLRLLESNGRRLLDLVETILDVARLEAGGLPVACARVELDALLRDTLEAQLPLANPREIALDVECAPGLPAAWADAELLRRVLQNLVGNAIKFAPAGSRVRITALSQEPGLVTLAVRDNGAGIPEELRGRLFQKFAAGRQAGRGTGLGLLFCRLAVEAHGGRIHVESEPGQGAAFVFSLPTAPRAGEPLRPSGPEPSRSSPGRTPS